MSDPEFQFALGMVLGMANMWCLLTSSQGARARKVKAEKARENLSRIEEIIAEFESPEFKEWDVEFKVIDAKTTDAEVVMTFRTANRESVLRLNRLDAKAMQEVFDAAFEGSAR